MELRDRNIERLDGGQFDVLVIGGGINGAVSAAALTARGVSVALVDRGDFANVTSQESSNLVWGGFKYLENYELRLVWKLCASRNQLKRAYPTAIAEIGFLATLDKTAPFPPWLAGLGTAGYWAMGRFATERPRYYRPPALEREMPIIDTETAAAGIQYGDYYLKENDARFVWNFVRASLDGGAAGANYVEVTGAERNGPGWTASLRDAESGREFELRARAIVNAAGPFVDGLNRGWGITTEHRIVYSKGIHLVVPRLLDEERVLAFFDDTGRLFYVIPMAHRSVIGTTDSRTDRADEGVTDEDRRFLIDQINARLDLDSPIRTSDVISERCGVRPLVVENDGDEHADTDWTSLSRRHAMETDRENKMITIFGGKLTDCLNVGDEITAAIAELGIDIGRRNGRWFGEPSTGERQRFYADAAALGLDRPPEIERADSMSEVLWRRHGEAAPDLLAMIGADREMAEPVLAASDVLRAELHLMAEREMITRLDDFLRRRTKLSLVTHGDDLGADPGMDEVNHVLFGS